MTTNHRPTLESKSGKAIGITNTITHSRALPQQTRLKYRNDTEIDSQVGQRAVEDLKRELLINEGKLIDTKRAGSFTEDSSKRIRIEDSDDTDDEETELLMAELAQLKKESGSGPGPGIQNHGEPHRITESGSIEAEKDKENEETSLESDSNDDSDEENRLLLEELAKIKQERLEKVKKTQQEEKTKKAMSSNPLVSISAETAPEPKKSWRNSTAFNRKPPPTKEDSESFTNDTLKSEIHQKFLSKYIR